METRAEPFLVPKPLKKLSCLCSSETPERLFQISFLIYRANHLKWKYVEAWFKKNSYLRTEGLIKHTQKVMRWKT